MKKQFYIFAVGMALSVNAAAFELGTFFDSSLVHEAEYNYVDASLLLNPDSFKGFELNGSFVVRPNLAVTGVFNRTSADVSGVSNSLSQIGLGARYFHALPNIEFTDLDLSMQLLNSSLDAGEVSTSDLALVLGGEARHVLGMAVGSSSLMWQEVYGGLQLGMSSDDFSVAFHAGLLVEINAQFSAKAELLIDDGAFLTIGARMQLGRAQSNPDAAAYKARLPANPVKAATKAPKVTESVMPAVIMPAEQQPSKPDNPYGLTEDEMGDLKKNAE